MKHLPLAAAFLCCASLPGVSPQAGNAGEAEEYTSAAAERLSAMAPAGPKLIKKIDGGQDRQDQFYFQGVPLSVKRIAPGETGLMRHWTSNAAADGVPVVDLIVKSGLLKAGTRVYIDPLAHKADYYQDLHGVFFTTPDFPPEGLLMGLKPDSDFVDFTVPPGMGALYLSPGNYLFPCPMKVRPWLAEAYRKWKAGGGNMPAGMETALRQIDREGGLREPIDIPITVVRYRKNGELSVLRPDLLR